MQLLSARSRHGLALDLMRRELECACTDAGASVGAGYVMWLLLALNAATSSVFISFWGNSMLSASIASAAVAVVVAVAARVSTGHKGKCRPTASTLSLVNSKIYCIASTVFLSYCICCFPFSPRFSIDTNSFVCWPIFCFAFLFKRFFLMFVVRLFDIVKIVTRSRWWRSHGLWRSLCDVADKRRATLYTQPVLCLKN